MRHIVGKIEEYDVIYSDEVDQIFCKNTSVDYEKLRTAIIVSSYDRHDFDDKKEYYKN